MENNWYKLDNAAKIYPAIRQSDWAPIFREDILLKEEVRPDVLQAALKLTYKRFPTFSVHMTRGLFWYYFEAIDSIPEARAEDRYPVRPFSEDKDKGYLFRVLYYGRRISLEVFHSISDGYGVSVFLKTLVYNYLSLLKSRELVDNPLELDKYGILYHKDIPTLEEMEDSFQVYAFEEEPLKLHENQAYEIKGSSIRKESLRIIHILLSVEELKGLAKEYDCTITEFLAALYTYSIFNSRIYRRADKRPVKISVPVNLRKHFPSKTLRNFSAYINVEVFPKEGDGKPDFKEICKAARDQLRSGIDRRTLRDKFSGNVHAEKNLVLRIAPLFIKNLVLKSIYNVVGERFMTSTLSNIGSIVLPKEMETLIERFDFVLGSPKKNSINCAVISHKDTISISFTSVISENSIFKEFVDFLVTHGLKVDLETNY
ncbi:MAG: hypothetical protein Q8930_09985 [Bacillota bacterium]|nr:hypothetical protein [Bacillota bacterium]